MRKETKTDNLTKASFMALGLDRVLESRSLDLI